MLVNCGLRPRGFWGLRRDFLFRGLCPRPSASPVVFLVKRRSGRRQQFTAVGPGRHSGVAGDRKGFRIAQIFEAAMGQHTGRGRIVLKNRGKHGGVAHRVRLDQGLHSVRGQPGVPIGRCHPIADLGLVPVHPFQRNHAHDLGRTTAQTVHHPDVLFAIILHGARHEPFGQARWHGMWDRRGHARDPRVAGIKFDQAHVGLARGAQNKSFGLDHGLAHNFLHFHRHVPPPNKTNRTEATVRAARVYIR
mmetsp:Transcript_28775/g.54619  ORF Transcript_28775/g.54619 Transcript_28775/m.54619 type:complete len:248 (+) Transcript_28775:1675-2418(+)